MRPHPVFVSALTSLVVLAARPRPVASAEPAAALDEVLEGIRARHHLPALGGAVVAEGKVTELGAVGVRRLGDASPVTKDDRWHLGSCTKAMTATLLGIFVEEKKLRWETTLAEAFPKLAGRMHASWRAVTLEQLLQHHGGAPHALEAYGNLWPRLRTSSAPPLEQRRMLVEATLAQPPETAPGTKAVYSNTGVVMVAYAMELKTGRTWEDLLRDRLFKPLAMRSAGFGAPGRPGKLDQPLGHSVEGGKLAPVALGLNADNPPALGPAGRVHATLADWAKFIDLHLRGARGETGLLLAPETFARLHRPGPPLSADPKPKASYALGWICAEREWAGGRVLMHTGSNTFWFAVVWAAPERNFAVLAVTNAGGDEADKACDEVASALIARHPR